MSVWRALAFLVVWLGAGAAQAEEVPGKRLLVAFEDSARALPQQQIREAIVVELADAATVEAGGSEARAVDVPTDRLSVALDEQGLWLKYQGPRGLVERHLPVPERTEQVPVVVSLAVGNLVREEAFELQRELERKRIARGQRDAAKRKAFAAEPRPLQPAPLPKSPPARPPAPMSSLAYYVTIAGMQQGQVSDPCSSQRTQLGWRCYAGGSPYQQPEEAYGLTNIRRQTQLSRFSWSVAYNFTFGPVGLSVRTGLAIVGGGTVPWFGDLRIRNLVYNAAFANNAIRPFWFSGIGVGGVETRVDVDGVEGIEAARQLGPMYLTSGVGLLAQLSKSWHAEAEWSFVVHLPETGTMLQTALGLAYDF